MRVKLPLLMLSVLVVVWLVQPALAEAPSDLKDYVQLPDDSYKLDFQVTETIGISTVHTSRLTSQTWRGQKWEHWLSIVVPKNLKYPDKAILLIAGGSHRAGKPNPAGPTAQMVLTLAEQVGVTFAVIQQVPYQPMFDGKYEDDLISYTFEQYIQNRGDDWPLLLPMTKSAVKAMDAVQQLIAEKENRQIDQFIVTGASKRGWTTWLAAAVDDRIMAIAPIVIDMLNLPAQVPHQKKTYGSYSYKIDDYTKRDMQEQMNTPRGKVLTKIVDPFSYRKQITIPKLLIMGTNDPYWTADATALYYDDLPGEKAIHFSANVGHQLAPTMVPTMLAFFKRVLQGQALPTVTWENNGNGSLHVKWEGSNVRPILWTSHSDNRDFREQKWTRKVIEVEDGARECTIEVDTPAEGEGWVAYFVETIHADNATVPFSLSTTIHVLPTEYPAHEVGAD